MDKIETPEEFVRTLPLVAFRPYKGTLAEALVKLLAARDALLRADERQKAAERADVAICEHYEEWSIGATRAGVKAAIMAEPEKDV